VGLTYLPTKLLEDSRRNKKKEKKRKREIEGGKKKEKLLFDVGLAEKERWAGIRKWQRNARAHPRAPHGPTEC
jgi:hypothetical protein